VRTTVEYHLTSEASHYAVANGVLDSQRDNPVRARISPPLPYPRAAHLRTGRHPYHCLEVQPPRAQVRLRSETWRLLSEPLQLPAVPGGG
jgi:hypothetical protein